MRKTKKCRECDGLGAKYYQYRDEHKVMPPSFDKCPKCNGSGRMLAGNPIKEFWDRIRNFGRG